MTDWRAAGQRADATRIRVALREVFASDAKHLVRQEVLVYLGAAGVSRPLDLWGGGLSAEAMVEAGMHPISVDDGRAAALVTDQLGQRVSAARFGRALRLSGDLAGYETRSGSVARHVADADGAFLDFCGHWSPQVERALLACRHMHALVVTLMPERAALGQLSVANWRTAYGALLTKASGMHLTSTRVYVRNELGQRAMVFFLRRQKTGINVEDIAGWRRARSQRRTMDPTARARKAERRQRPEIKARDAERQRAYRQRPEVKAMERDRYCAYSQRPEVKARKAARMRAYDQRPEVKAREAAKNRAYRQRPEVKARNAANRRAYDQRPEVREARRIYQAAYSQTVRRARRAGGTP